MLPVSNVLAPSVLLYCPCPMLFTAAIRNTYSVEARSPSTIILVEFSFVFMSSYTIYTSAALFEKVIYQYNHINIYRL